MRRDSQIESKVESEAEVRYPGAMKPERGPLSGCEPPISCMAPLYVALYVAIQSLLQPESSKHMIVMNRNRGL